MRHERERSDGGVVEPLRVVDQAQEWLLLRSLGEKTENGEPDEKRARRLSRPPPECDVESVTLGVGKSFAELQERRTERLQRSVVELHLSLDARGADQLKVLARVVRVFEQRSLADPGISVHHEHTAVSIACRLEQAVEHVALALAADQLLPDCP